MSPVPPEMLERGRRAGADHAAPERRSAAARTMDVLALGSLLLIALIGLRPLYGGWFFLISGAVALVLSLGIALLGARWRWGPTRTALALLLVYVLLGTPFAVPESALWMRAVPSLRSLLALATATVTAWRTAMTMTAPVGASQGVLAVVWITMLVLPQLAFAVLLRTRHYLLAWLFPFGLLAITIALGTTAAAFPLARGIAFALISLAWISWRQEGERLRRDTSEIIGDAGPGSPRTALVRRRLLGAALVLALAGGSAVWAFPHLREPAGTARPALRDRVVPPADLQDYTSPLAQLRARVTDQRDVQLLQVSGAAPGDRLRLASLDAYDRQVFKVAGGDDPTSPSGAFLRTAADVDLGGTSGGLRHASVTVAAYSGPWLPTLGEQVSRISPEGAHAARLTSDLYLNRAAQTALVPGGLRTGDRYDLAYEPYRAPTPQEQASLRFGRIDLPALPRLDPTVRSTAEELLGQDRSDYARMQRLTDAIASRAVLSDGQQGQPPALPGHGERRLTSMLADFDLDHDDPDSRSTSLVGDDEQLAALVTVLARSAGVPARVAVGFTVPKGSSSGNVAVTGKDASAWVEVYFADRGWVRFDPSPDAVARTSLPTAPLAGAPAAAAGIAPSQVAAPDVAPPPLPARRILPRVHDAADAWRLVGLWIGIPAGAILLVLVAIVLTKARRRYRRRERGEAYQRMNGGWLEVLDHARDLGIRLPRQDTRRETAQRIADLLPGADAQPVARWADRGTFGPDPLPAEEVYEYWREVRRTRRSMSAATARRRRLRAIFSTRSLRRHRPGGGEAG